MKKKFDAAVIIHHVDWDGFCGAYWATKYALDLVEDKEKIFYRKHDYPFKVNMPNIVPNTLVIMVDISFPVKEMREMYELCKSTPGCQFIWIDHHATAINAMSTEMLEDGKSLNDAIEGIRFNGIAACELMYFYYQGLTQRYYDNISMRGYIKGHTLDGFNNIINELWIPQGTYFVSDNDTWTHSTRYTRYYLAYLGQTPDHFQDRALEWYTVVFENPTTDNLDSDIIDRLIIGEKVYNKTRDEVWVPLVKTGGVFYTEVDGVKYSAYIIDTNRWNSFLFETVEEEVDLFCKHTLTQDGRHKYTLYAGNSDKAPDINIGEFCKKCHPSGGGHYGAGGFTSETEVFHK